MKSGEPGYERHKEQANAHAREMSKSAREIGPIPPPIDAARRESCRQNFRLFCETYGAESFPLEWSDDHLRAIEKIEAAVLRVPIGPEVVLGVDGVHPAGRRRVGGRVEHVDPTAHRPAAEQTTGLVGQTVVEVADDGQVALVAETQHGR